MSTVPKLAQARATQKTTIIVAIIERPMGDGGASTISKAAGRKAAFSLSTTFVTARESNDLISRLHGALPGCDKVPHTCRRGE